MSCTNKTCQCDSLDVWVLCGGPDRERPVSLQSAQGVAQALVQAKHRTILCDVNDENIQGVLDEFESLPTTSGKILFPMIHGVWGEGGALQSVLEARGLPFVTTSAAAAKNCIDKNITKQRMQANDIPTLDFKMLDGVEDDSFESPMVIKAIEEGSSFGMAICHNQQEAKEARELLFKDYSQLMAERYLKGKEITVSVLEKEGQLIALPPILIVPKNESYDYEAKYESNDTQYLFETGLPSDVIDRIKAYAIKIHKIMGARDLSRVDFLVDDDNQPWALEINTIPGFTSHSLFPKAANEYGLPLPQLVDLLVRQAYQKAGVCGV